MRNPYLLEMGRDVEITGIAECDSYQNGGRIIIGEFGSSIAIWAEDKYFFVYDDKFIEFI